jgi:hypothetical protein
MCKYLLKLLLPFLFLACTHTPETSQHQKSLLAGELRALDERIPAEEARRLSQEIFLESAKLRKKFKPVSEPHFNNFLINIGMKEQGLCYQWSDALYVHFRKSSYPHFDFHLLVSGQGEYFSEHNVLVVVAKGEDVMDGIIIDPWREPGSVYFVKVKDDHGYEWKHRAQRGCLH